MTLYNVHIYREIRLTFRGIDADTPNAATTIARDGLASDADDINDCDGADFCAIVDVAGDEEFKRSIIIDFGAERLRKAAPVLSEALAWLATASEDLDAAIDGATDQFNSERAELQAACHNAREALAKISTLYQPIERSNQS